MFLQDEVTYSSVVHSKKGKKPKGQKKVSECETERESESGETENPSRFEPCESSL